MKQIYFNPDWACDTIDDQIVYLIWSQVLVRFTERELMSTGDWGEGLFP